MNHAALIMAHKNEEQLIRLINAIKSENVDVFVHLDRNWKLKKSQIAAIKNCGKNVFVIKKRIHGILDTFSLPKIELNLIKAAINNEKKANKEYGYFMLLSGQDYPIKSKKYIYDFLEEQYPKPLIDFEPAEENNWVWGKYQLTRWQNKIEEIQLKHKTGVVRKLKVALCLAAEKTEKLFCGVPWRNLQNVGVKIYGGSQWWILPHGAVEYVLKQIRHNKKVIKQLKRAWTPEENFFQTVIMNSPFTKYMVEKDPIFDTGLGNFKAMTYCNFITPTKPFRGHPHIICVEDYQRIMAKKALFARKFDTKIDSAVLDMIDKAICE